MDRKLGLGVDGVGWVANGDGVGLGTGLEGSAEGRGTGGFFAAFSFSMRTCNSFEMQSLFMLVLWSLASAFSASWRLSGSRTVITRVASFLLPPAFLVLRLATIFWISANSADCSNRTYSSCDGKTALAAPLTPRVSRKKVTQSGFS